MYEEISHLPKTTKKTATTSRTTTKPGDKNWIYLKNTLRLDQSMLVKQSLCEIIKNSPKLECIDN